MDAFSAEMDLTHFQQVYDNGEEATQVLRISLLILCAC